MKKIIISAGIFVIIFAIVLILTFPYADYMEKTIQELNDSNEVKIFWQNSENKFLATELQNLTVTSKQGELLKLDKLTIKPSVIGGISLSGEGTDNLALKGDIRGGKLNLDVTEYPIPPSIATMTGDGKFKITGNYHFKKKTGNIDFSGTLKKIPNPLIKESLSVAGRADLYGNEAEINFDAKGQIISGAGKINVKGKQIGGNVKLDTGIIPINVQLSGELNNIKIKL